MEEREELEQCETVQVHQDIVEKVDAEMPDEEILYDLAELFKLFGDSTRIKILYVLFASEMCMSQSAISHQLRALKQAKLVRYRREGKQVFYSLADGHVRTILGQGMEHVAE